MSGEIFISYRRADEQWAQLLHRALRDKGVEAWYDAKVGAGQDWRIATAKALEASQIFVLLFSSNAALSDDIAKELAAATLEKKLIVPVRLENIAPKGAFLYELASRNWVDVFEEPEAKLIALADSLAKLVNGGNQDGTILPFNRTASGKSRSRRLTRNKVVFAGAALVIIIVAGAFAIRAVPQMSRRAPATHPQYREVRIAVLPFDVLGDDAPLRHFSTGLQAQIVEQLSQNQVSAITGLNGANPAGQGGAAQHVAYILSGTIERSGQQFLVRAHLDDARQSVTVWSSEFTGDAADPRTLQEEISAQTALIGAAAVNDDRLAKGDPDIMTLLIKADEYSLSILPKNKEVSWETARQLVEKLPNSAFSHSLLAVVSASLAVESAPERAARLRTDAEREAKRALALDPRNASAYFAQSFLFPSIGHWAAREKFLLQGLSASPQNGLLTNIESNFLREVGRLKDAVAYGRQAQAPVPPSANRDATLILALSATGNSFEAAPLAQTAAQSWPSHPAIWNARFELALFQAQWDDALDLLTPGGYLPLPKPIADAWRSALKAMKSGDRRAKLGAVQDLVAQLNPASPWMSTTSDPPSEVMTPGATIAMLAVLGDKDAAFAQAHAYLKRDSFADSSFLFWPNLTEFRRDPRFMELAAQIGLVDYWRSSGKWPDFCTEPTPPYKCSK